MVVNNGPIQTHRRHRRHTPSTLSTIPRYKKVTKHKNQLKTTEIDNIQTHSSNQRRAMYNARQTPLIPLIVDINLSLLDEFSQQQDDLLMDIVILLKNIHEECSFFEQFKIEEN